MKNGFDGFWNQDSKWLSDIACVNEMVTQIGAGSLRIAWWQPLLKGKTHQAYNENHTIQKMENGKVGLSPTEVQLFSSCFLSPSLPLSHTASPPPRFSFLGYRQDLRSANCAEGLVIACCSAHWPSGHRLTDALSLIDRNRDTEGKILW